VSDLVEIAKQKAKWVFEGVFGELAAQFFPLAGTLVWLDLSWAECKQSLDTRGSESKLHMNREHSVQGHCELLKWAEAYYVRTGSCSQAGHRDLFNAFAGVRYRLCTKEQVDEYLNAA
jgi:hypothetical protein